MDIKSFMVLIIAAAVLAMTHPLDARALPREAVRATMEHFLTSAAESQDRLVVS